MATDKTLVTVNREDLANALRDPKIGTPEMNRLTDAILYGTDAEGNTLNRAAVRAHRDAAVSGPH